MSRRDDLEGLHLCAQLGMMGSVIKAVSVALYSQETLCVCVCVCVRARVCVLGAVFLEVRGYSMMLYTEK